MDPSTTIKFALSKTNGLDIKYDGKSGKDCQFSGFIGELFNGMFAYCKGRTGYNCTIDNYNGLGNYNATSGNYSGAIGGFQEGGSDFLPNMIYFPLEGQIDSLKYTLPVLQDTMGIMSMYNKSSLKRDKQLTEMFSAVPSAMWFVMLAFFIAQIMFLITNRKFFGGNGIFTPMWDTFCTFIDQDSFRIDKLHMEIFMIFYSVGLFLQMSLIMNLASTDLMIYKDPIVVRSYQDIYDRNITLYMSQNYPEYEKFLNQPKGSIESKIKPVIFQFRGNYLGQKTVVGGRFIFLKPVGMMLLDANYRDIDQARVLISYEDEPKRYTNHLIYRDDLHPIYMKQFNVIFQRLSETGTFVHVIKLFPEKACEGLGIEPHKTIFETKIGTEVETTKPDTQNVEMKHIYDLIIYGFSMFIFALAVLLHEFFHYYIDRYQRKKKKQLEKKKQWQSPVIKPAQIENVISNDNQTHIMSEDKNPKYTWKRPVKVHPTAQELPSSSKTHDEISSKNLSMPSPNKNEDKHKRDIRVRRRSSL